MCAAVAPDGSVFSAGDDGRVIQSTAPRQHRVWAQLPGRIHKIALTRDGRHLFPANSNGAVYVLRLQERK
jgi:hypothetical protein